MLFITISTLAQIALVSASGMGYSGSGSGSGSGVAYGSGNGNRPLVPLVPIYGGEDGKTINGLGSGDGEDGSCAETGEMIPGYVNKPVGGGGGRLPVDDDGRGKGNGLDCAAYIQQKYPGLSNGYKNSCDPSVVNPPIKHTYEYDQCVKMFGNCYFYSKDMTKVCVCSEIGPVCFFDECGLLNP
ncbi:hypothetical protein AX774_g1030, partial [Zancudomyces culisetae]